LCFLKVLPNTSMSKIFIYNNSTIIWDIMLNLSQ
jgi:hypothetical protein